MKIAKLDSAYFPANERLQYGLKMLGAKGSIVLEAQRTDDAVKLKCQILGSLIIPPKKLVDSEITTRLVKATDGDSYVLQNYTDQDFKSETRRQMEVKSHGIETRYSKFDEERGYIEFPEGKDLQNLVDPLSITFLARDKELLAGQSTLRVHLLVRTGILEIQISPIDEKLSYVDGFNEERKLIRLGTELLKTDLPLKGPYISPDMEVWADAETGVLAEISYPFLGSFGRALLVLQKSQRS